MSKEQPDITPESELRLMRERIPVADVDVLREWAVIALDDLDVLQIENNKLRVMLGETRRPCAFVDREFHVNEACDDCVWNARLDIAIGKRP